MFRSETDTEVLAHMLAGRIERGEDLLDAVRGVVAEAAGAYSLIAVDSYDPGRLVAARIGNAGGIVVGVGEHENLAASDLNALLPHTRQVVFVEPGEFADIRAEGVRYVNAAGHDLVKMPETLPYDPVAAVKGPYKHFMQKEIFEQPDAVLDVMRGRYFPDGHVDMSDGVPFDAAWAKQINRVVLVGMGTSMHSAMIGRHYMERFARIREAGEAQAQEGAR